jgi:WD40 repeat protein
MNNSSTIFLLDAASGRKLHTLRAHSSPSGRFSHSAFSPDGSLLAVSWSFAGQDGRSIRYGICLFDVRSGELRNELVSGNDEVGCLVFSPDGARIFCGRQADHMQVWNMRTARRIRTLDTKHKNTIESVAWSPDRKLLATASWDETIWLWDAATFKPIAQLTGHHGAVNTCAFSPDSRYLVSGSDDKTVKYWDVNLAREVLTLRGHKKRVTAVAFSRDGRLLVSSSEDGTVRLWGAGPEKPSGAP